MNRRIFDGPLVNESSRNKITTAPILYFSTQGTAVQMLHGIRFLFRDDSFTRGQPPISVTGHWRILSYKEALVKVLLKE